jgi:hypothetical protein
MRNLLTPFKRNEKKFTAMKNDDREREKSIILKVLRWHLLEECREIYERFVLFADFLQRFDMKITEGIYE